VTANLIQQFGECIFEWDGLGRLQRVEYTSEWKQTQRDPRRGSIDRRITPERRKLPESVCVPVREKRKEQRRKNPPERRDFRRLRCDFCRKDFPDVPSLVDHLPCKAIHELVRLGFWDFVAGIARNGGPSSSEAKRMRNIVLASLSVDAYHRACSDQLFVPQRLVSVEENLRTYRLAWLAVLLSLIRPTQISLDLLTRTDREEFSRIAETFIHMPDGPQRKIVGQFFALSVRLEEIGKTGRVPKKPISDRTRTAFVETIGMRGQRRANAMTTLEADYWSPLTALQAYQANANGFSRDLYTLGSRIQSRSKRATKSSPASR
jgi:hypothetical protein